MNDRERSYLAASARAVAETPRQAGELLGRRHVSFKRTPCSDALLPYELKRRPGYVVVEKLERNDGIRASAIRPPRIGAAVVCRLKSKRLAGKAVRPLAGTPAIERCLINTLAIPGLTGVTLATSILDEDTPLEAHTLSGAVGVFLRPS